MLSEEDDEENEIPVEVEWVQVFFIRNLDQHSFLISHENFDVLVLKVS